MTGLLKRTENEKLYERKGNVADKNGRNMKRPWAKQAILVALSADVLDGQGRKTKKLRIIIDRLINAAMSGEPWAIQEVLNRVDGKPTTMIGGDPENPLMPAGGLGKFIVEYVDAPLEDAPVDITPNKVAD